MRYAMKLKIALSRRKQGFESQGAPIIYFGEFLGNKCCGKAPQSHSGLRPSPRAFVRPEHSIVVRRT